MATTISEIQGEGAKSPLENMNVKKVSGIVTNVFSNKYNQGFYMQDLGDNNDKTSDGIWVETKQEVKVGDLVRVDGVVKEIQFGKWNPANPTETSINASNISVISHNNTVKAVEL